MTNKNVRKRLIELLSNIEFADKYYANCELSNTCREDYKVNYEEVDHVLKSLGLICRFDGNGKFFVCKDYTKSCELELRIAFLYSSCLEFMLSVKTRHGYVGDPFALLASEIKEAEEPGFEYSPPSPLPKFSNHRELLDALVLGITLYKEARYTIASYGGWNNGAVEWDRLNF